MKTKNKMYLAVFYNEGGPFWAIATDNKKKLKNNVEYTQKEFQSKCMFEQDEYETVVFNLVINQ